MLNISAQDTVNALRQILHIDHSLTGLDYLKVFVKKISLALDIKYVFVGHASASNQGYIQTDVVWGDGKYIDNFRYELKSTPCEMVMAGERVCIHDRAVCSKFPEDDLLKNMGIQAYIGAPTVSPEGKLLGLLVLLDDKPVEHSSLLVSIVDFLSRRVSEEYERYSIENELQMIINQKTEELISANVELQETRSTLQLTKKQLEITHRIDELTNINNKAWFLSLADSQLKIAERNTYPISLLFIDLDDFKEVNDSYGHTAGDAVLKETASRIQLCIRDIDILGRFSGAEFILLSPYSDATAAANLAQRIKTTISDTPVHVDKKNIFVTSSIGITSSETDTYKLDHLLEHADAALYQAKNRGRNRFQIYTSHDEPGSRQ